MSRFICFLALILSLSLPALAGFAPTSPDVQNVERYLNGITTLKAKFIQTDNDGKQTAGKFMLKRPGRLRFEYAAPVTDFIVADGLLVYYYDGQLKQQSSVPISSSLADFFLRKDLKLSGDIKVTDVKRSDGLLQVTLVQTKDPMGGSLTLGLAENPLALKKWRILDSQGAITEVNLIDAEAGINLDSGLFKYYDPTHQTPRYN